MYFNICEMTWRSNVERVITAALLLVIVVGAVLLYCITLKYHIKNRKQISLLAH